MYQRLGSFSPVVDYNSVIIVMLTVICDVVNKVLLHCSAFSVRELTFIFFSVTLFHIITVMLTMHIRIPIAHPSKMYFLYF